MKKVIVAIVILSAAVAALPQTGQAADLFNFYVRTGLITEDDFSFSPLLWTVGANFDFNLGPMLILSPECDLIVHQFNFSPVWLTPAVTLNLNLSGLYVGAGLAKFIMIGSGYTLTSDFLFKLNGGFKTDSFKLQVYTLSSFSHLFSDMAVGFTLGFGF